MAVCDFASARHETYCTPLSPPHKYLRIRGCSSAGAVSLMALLASPFTGKRSQPIAVPEPKTPLRKLEDVASLHKSGALTDEEYEAEKRRILDDLHSAADLVTSAPSISGPRRYPVCEFVARSWAKAHTPGLRRPVWLM